MSIAKPFIKWAGGKSKLLSRFDDLLPLYWLESRSFTYIEPFVGGGAMLFHMLSKFPNIERAIINDINPNLVMTYKVIRDYPDALIIELSKMQNEFRSLKVEELKKDFYLEIRKLYNTEEHNNILKSAMFIFLNRTCFNGLHRVNSKGQFNVPFGKYENPTICDEETILTDSQALQNVEILCGDFSNIEPFVSKDTFLYFDPPYRPLNSNSSFTSYAKEEFGDYEQIRLAQLYKRLSERGCQMMLSNSDCSAYNPDDKFLDELYEGFSIERVFASRSINSNPLKRGKLSEIVVRNYGQSRINLNTIENISTLKKAL